MSSKNNNLKADSMPDKKANRKYVLITITQMLTMIRKFTKKNTPEGIQTPTKRRNLKGKLTRRLSLRNLMFIGTMFRDFKTPKMLSKKLLLCLSGSPRFSKEAENRGLVFYYMGLLEQEKHFLPKHVRHKLKVPFFRYLHPT